MASLRTARFEEEAARLARTITEHHGAQRSPAVVRSSCSTEHVIERRIDRNRSRAQVKNLAGTIPIGEQRAEDGGNVVTWDGTSKRCRLNANSPRTDIVSQTTWSQDRPVQITRFDCHIGSCLGPQVDLKAPSPRGGSSTPALLTIA
jgi:hypothetical protein